MKIEPNETDMLGKWVVVDGKVVADATVARINDLVDNYLEEMGTDKTGWSRLYKDPNDGRLWEFTYPNSSWQGGGPPRLTYLSEEQARERFRHLFKWSGTENNWSSNIGS